MDMFFWIIGAVIVVIIFLLVKARYIKHKLVWVLIFIFIFFFYVSFVWSGISKNVDLKTFEGAKIAGKVYLAWLTNAFNNLKIITGDALNMNWNINRTQSSDSTANSAVKTTAVKK